MKTITNKLALGSAVLAPLMPLAVKAQDYNYDYSTTSDLTDAQAGGILAGFGVMFFLFMAVGLAFFVFWIMMLVHASKNDVPDKNTWIIVLVASFVFGLGGLGALVYYFAVKRKFDAGVKPVAKAPKAKA